MKIFLTGGSSGIGKAVYEMLCNQHEITAPSRSEFDLENFDQIDQLDLSDYDAVINCAGANVGAWQGWHRNSWQNQVTQVNVNFTGALLLAKQYTRQRSQGQFIYVTSASANDPIAYNIFMVASKAALRYSLDAVKKEFPNMVFSEVCPGKTRTNMLRQNYQNAKTDTEIDKMYDSDSVLTAKQVANVLASALELKLDQVTIVPHGPGKN
jgi:short-subunit dehydrogenase